MTGLAWKIAKTTNPGLQARKKEIQLPAEIEVTDKDIDEAYGKKVTTKDNASARLHLTLSKGRDGGDYLTIVKPANDIRNVGAYFVDLTRELMGASKDDGIVVEHSDAMKQAMATAIAELPAVRERFLRDKIPKGGKLILKFKSEKGKDTEYLWAFVTDWKNVKEAHGCCGNDSEFDPKLRAGQPLTLKLDSIVDWAVVVENDIVEGGSTAKLLMKQQQGK